MRALQAVRALAPTLFVLLATATALLAQTPQVEEGAGSPAEIKRLVEQLRVAGPLTIAGRSVTHSEALASVYEERSFAPLWMAEGKAAELRAALAGLSADGLDPDDYHLQALSSAASASAAELDVLRTDAFIRAAYHLKFGKVTSDGAAVNRDLSRPLRGDDATAALRRMLETGSIRVELEALRPSHFVYRGLVAALADLRRIQRDGGWETIPAGPAMRRDSSDARVPQLRQRLRLSGDLADSVDSAPAAFDAALESAVRAFQHRHALNEDGVVGPATLRELNVPVGTRIDLVRVNLERARWVLRDLEDTFVAVNVAGAIVYLIRDGETAFEARAVVGQPYTRTPVFTGSMRYIDLNPTWTVPPGIVGEVLAHVRRDRGWLAREGMRVLDRSGRAVSPARIDFSRYSARTFPYVFRQDPGPRNPLGRVKFVFPNRYNVYLHDTPSRALFEREQRTFSHGCIRVQNPLRLAELVLDDPERWNEEGLQAAIDAGGTRTIPLTRPLPVLVLYWTASADLHGELHFYRDVYGRDPPVLRALETP